MDMLVRRLDGRAVLYSLRQAGNWTTIILIIQVEEASVRAIALEEGAGESDNRRVAAQLYITVRQFLTVREGLVFFSMASPWRIYSR
jgi:hypothetical protein